MGGELRCPFGGLAGMVVSGAQASGAECVHPHAEAEGGEHVDQRSAAGVMGADVAGGDEGEAVAAGEGGVRDRSGSRGAHEEERRGGEEFGLPTPGGQKEGERG